MGIEPEAWNTLLFTRFIWSDKCNLGCLVSNVRDLKWWLVIFLDYCNFSCSVSSHGGSKLKTNGEMGPLYFSGSQISNLSIRVTSFLPLKDLLWPTPYFPVLHTPCEKQPVMFGDQLFRKNCNPFTFLLSSIMSIYLVADETDHHKFTDLKYQACKVTEGRCWGTIYLLVENKSIRTGSENTFTWVKIVTI